VSGLSQLFHSQKSEERGEHSPLGDGEDGWGFTWVRGTERRRMGCAPGGEPPHLACLGAGHILLLSQSDSSRCLLGFRVPSSSTLHVVHPSCVYLHLVNPLAGKKMN